MGSAGHNRFSTGGIKMDWTDIAVHNLIRCSLEWGWGKGFDKGYIEGYQDGHKDGMKEAVTTITE